MTGQSVGTLTPSSARGPAARSDGPALSGTTIRFAVLVLVMTASTGSIFGYFWQLAHPAQVAAAQACEATVPFELSLSTGVRYADCVRGAAVPLALWCLTGVVLLAAGSTAGYLLGGRWVIRFGWPGHRHRLLPLDAPQFTGRYEAQLRRLEQLAAQAGTPLRRAPGQLAADPGPVPSAVTFLVDPCLRDESAQAFGTRRAPRVRLGHLMLSRFESESQRFDAKVLHELAHIREQDLRPTYLTLAAWRCFTVLGAAGYAAALIMSPARPALPDAHTIAVVLTLLASVYLSVRAVLRTRELHADAVADQRLPAGVLLTLIEQAKAADPARWIRWLMFHDAHARAAALEDPGRLYRPDLPALAAAGLGIAVLSGQLAPLAFTALLGTPLAGVSLLGNTTTPHVLLFQALNYGPSALAIALPAAGLASATAWQARRHPRQHTDRAPALLAATVLAAGMTAGGLTDFNDAVAGIWGVLDTNPASIAAALAIATGALLLILTLLFLWAHEAAQAWSHAATRHARVLLAATAGIGALMVLPMLLAWSVVRQIPLAIQWLIGPSALEAPHVATWPAAHLAFFHEFLIGDYNLLPGAAGVLTLGCLFVAAGGWFRPRNGAVSETRPPRVPVLAVLACGCLGALAATCLGYVLILHVRTLIGPQHILPAGGFAVIYMTRSVQAAIALCAATAATGAALTTRHTRLTTAILTGQTTTVLAALVAPQLVYIGYLGPHHKAVNPINGHFFYGVLTTLTFSITLLATAALLTISKPLTVLTHRVRLLRLPRTQHTPHPRRRPAVPYPVVRLAEVLLLCSLLTGLAYADYYYYSLAVPTTAQIHPAHAAS